MTENCRPTPPDLPDYVADPIAKQDPETLDAIADYATELAAWKRSKRSEDVRRRRKAESISESERSDLEDREVSTDPADYEDVPSSGAYITVKETKPGYRYFYWQWREGDGWKNEYIAPVDPEGEGE